MPANTDTTRVIVRRTSNGRQAFTSVRSETFRKSVSNRARVARALSAILANAINVLI